MFGINKLGGRNLSPRPARATGSVTEARIAQISNRAGCHVNSDTGCYVSLRDAAETDAWPSQSPSVTAEVTQPSTSPHEDRTAPADPGSGPGGSSPHLTGLAPFRSPNSRLVGRAETRPLVVRVRDLVPCDLQTASRTEVVLQPTLREPQRAEKVILHRDTISNLHCNLGVYFYMNHVPRTRYIQIHRVISGVEVPLKMMTKLKHVYDVLRGSKEPRAN